MATLPALPVAFASHFVLDFIPHFDFHKLLGIKHSNPTSAEVALVTLDVVLGCALVLCLSHSDVKRRLMRGAAFAAVVIDLIDNIPPWSYWIHANPHISWISSFHHGIQHNAVGDQWPIGLAAQLAAIAIGLFAIYVMKRRASAKERIEIS